VYRKATFVLATRNVKGDVASQFLFPVRDGERGLRREVQRGPGLVTQDQIAVPPPTRFHVGALAVGLPIPYSG
jgi:hypothetical protein